MSVMALDMVYAVAYLVSYVQIGANLLLRIWASIYLHTVFHNSISFYTTVYIYLPIRCDIFIIHI